MLKPPALRGSTGSHFLQSIAVLEAAWRTAQGISFLPNRKLVFVVDDDPGMLRSVARMLPAVRLRQLAVSVCGGFRKPERFRQGGLRSSRHQPRRWVRDRA